MSRTRLFILILGIPTLMIILLHIYPYDISGEEADLKFFTEYSLPAGKLPIFYRNEYNISLWGIENLHPFDSKKYGKVFHQLVESRVIQENQVVHPFMPSREILLEIHTDQYLQSLNKSDTIARIAEIFPIRYLPGKLLRSKILNPMLYASGGTIMAAKAALETGWAINLGGGFHHASKESGGGFCFYSDIAMVIKVLRDNGHYCSNVMIVDLDAHQGNGYEKDFLGDDKVYILDIYNSHIYPNDLRAKLAINKGIELGSGISDDKYLMILATELNAALHEFYPDLIIYNAGTDILRGDPLGGMNITEEGIIRRDEIVFGNAISKRIPIIMLLSGGYQKQNAAVIAESIQNLFQTVLKKPYLQKL